MNSLPLVQRAAFLALVIGLFSTTTSHAALVDTKTISSSACQPLYTGASIDPALLRFTSEGITNYYPVSKYVICPIPKDADNSWDADFVRVLYVFFKKNNNGGAVTSNACSLTVGTKMMGSKTTTLYANIIGTLPEWPYSIPINAGYGAVSFDEENSPNGFTHDPVTLVCVIAPLNTLEFIYLREGDAA